MKCEKVLTNHDEINFLIKRNITSDNDNVITSALTIVMSQAKKVNK